MHRIDRLHFAVIGGVILFATSASRVHAQEGPAGGSPGGEPSEAEPPSEDKPLAPADKPGAPMHPPAEPSADGAGAEETEDPGNKIPGNMGQVRGLVVDGKTGEGLIEAQITVIKTGKKVLTDVDGNYKINLPPGVYELRVFAELKPARRIGNVRVTKGKVTHIDVALDSADDKAPVQEIEVVAAPNTATEAVQIVRRQKAAVVSDGISAQQIAKSPDTNASDSIKRVVAATVQDNRYVVIRGLGGRYSSTLLNGVILPSPDPDVPAAPLDLFPAQLLANLTIAKSFSPDLPGNFAGGVLQIETRDFPSKFMFTLRAAGSADTQSTFRGAYNYKGGGLDFLGYDDGTRKMPAEIPRGTKLAEAGDGTPEDARLKQWSSFPNNYNLRSHQLSPNIGFTTVLGDTVSLGNQKIGYLASVNYGHRWVRRVTDLRRYGEVDPVTKKLNPSVEQLRDETGTELPSLGGLLTVGWAPSPAHRINLTTLYTHNTENSAGRISGRDDSDLPIERLRFRFLERGMWFSQLIGEDAIAPGKVLLGWQASFAKTTQHEPDTRDLLRGRVPNGQYWVGYQSGGSERMYSDLGDTSYGGGLDLSFLLNGAKIKAGGLLNAASRTYVTRRFHYNARSPLDLGATNEAIFNPANFGSGLTMQENTLPADSYEATRAIWAGYVMADIVKLDPVRIIVGERFEVSNLDVKVGNVIVPPEPGKEGTKRTDKALLPSLNGVLALTKEMNLRAGYSGTVARPHFREIAPALYFDYVRRRTIGGEPNLQETRIQNADLRWESFFGPTELLAASVFYKHFSNPIERTIEVAGSGTNVNFKNAPSAYAYGVEFEARSSLARLSPTLSPISLATNLSLIHSRVNAPGAGCTAGQTNCQTVARALQGQSPYVVNFSVTYQLEKTDTTFSALYNVFGPRIDEVGTAGNPNTLEQPVHRVDVTVNQRLPMGFNGKLSVTNVLDQRVVFKQEDVEILAYKPGVGFFGVVEWTLRDGKEN
jgi:hypothetical protein